MMTTIEKVVLQSVRDANRNCKAAISYIREARRWADKTRDDFGGNLFRNLNEAARLLTLAMAHIEAES